MINKVIILIVGVLAITGAIYFAISRKNTSTKTAASNSLPSYTLAQVATHASENDCWMVIDSNVYNATSYIPQHPNPDILQGCGQDATQIFSAQRKHNGGQAQRALATLLIGKLSATTTN